MKIAKFIWSTSSRNSYEVHLLLHMFSYSVYKYLYKIQVVLNSKNDKYPTTT